MFPIAILSFILAIFSLYKRNMKLNILITENDKLWALTLQKMLAPYGIATIASNEDEAFQLLASQKFDICFIDLDLDQRLGGLNVVKKVKSVGSYGVIISGNDENEIIAQGYSYGCMDYLTKPVNQSAIELIFRRFETTQNAGKIDKLLQERFITQDEQTLDSLEIIKRVNLSKKAVLLNGESGTGKTCLARIIHEASSGEDTPFVSLNCSQFNDNTLESELFGHVKGSFTGAHKDKVGLIKKAEGGTLFLDEVHSLSNKAQQKLLTAIETGVIYPLGSEKSQKVNFRVICATCESLEELIAQGKFRRDLYYRIKTFVIYLKPLGERKCDIKPLIEYRLSKLARKIVVADEAMKALESYSWPANAREVEDMVENWDVMGLGIVNLNDLPEYVTNAKIELNTEGQFFTPVQLDILKQAGLKEFLEIVKQAAIDMTLEAFNGKQVEAAKSLGVSKSFISKNLGKGKLNEPAARIQ